jgi:hypothetical protein
MIPKNNPPHILYNSIFTTTYSISISNVFGSNLDMPDKAKNIRIPEASLSNDSSSISLIKCLGAPISSIYSIASTGSVIATNTPKVQASAHSNSTV